MLSPSLHLGAISGLWGNQLLHTPCFNFKGISPSLHSRVHRELKAHLCHLMVWQNLQCTFINWMHHGKPKVFCSFCNINHEHLEEGSVVINSHTNNTAQIWLHPEISVHAETKRQPISPKTHIVLHKL